MQVISETIRDAPLIHIQVASVYKHWRAPLDPKQISNRKNDVLIARLRSGYHPSLKQYLHQFDPLQDPTCRNCYQEEQDLLHWFCDCPALITVRHIWLPSRVLRVACHSTWRCSDVSKKDPDQPWRLTQ